MVIVSGTAIYCDVDDTLVIWGKPDHPDAIEIAMDWGNGRIMIERLIPHKKHIDILKASKFRGHKVVVWSAGGDVWAEAVVKALGIEEYVDLVISKPSWYIDDLRSEEFMPEANRIYKEDYKSRNQDRSK